MTSLRSFGAAYPEQARGELLATIQKEAERLNRLVGNLLDNAAKYAPDGSRITVAARRDADHVVIEVADEGPGIPPPDLERVFGKFYRILAADRQVAGTGLGLSICRGLVEAHGGTIVARSPVADGRGTAFVIRLPVDAQPALGDAAARPAA